MLSKQARLVAIHGCVHKSIADSFILIEVVAGVAASRMRALGLEPVELYFGNSPASANGSVKDRAPAARSSSYKQARCLQSYWHTRRPAPAVSRANALKRFRDDWLVAASLGRWRAQEEVFGCVTETKVPGGMRPAPTQELPWPRTS